MRRRKGKNEWAYIADADVPKNTYLPEVTVTEFLSSGSRGSSRLTKAYDPIDDAWKESGRWSQNPSNPRFQSVPRPQTISSGFNTNQPIHQGIHQGPSGPIIVPSTINPEQSLVEEVWESLQPLVQMEVERRCNEIVGALQDQITEMWELLREDDDE